MASTELNSYENELYRDTLLFETLERNITNRHEYDQGRTPTVGVLLFKHFHELIRLK